MPLLRPSPQVATVACSNLHYPPPLHGRAGPCSDGSRQPPSGAVPLARQQNDSSICLQGHSRHRRQCQASQTLMRHVTQQTVKGIARPPPHPVSLCTGFCPACTIPRGIASVCDACNKAMHLSSRQLGCHFQPHLTEGGKVQA